MLLVIAGVDALRSSDGEPTATAASPTEAVTTTRTETAADVESSPGLQQRRLVKLTPGRVGTDERFGPFVTFTVPPGWYGYQDLFGFLIGNGLNGDAVAFRSGGISVDTVWDRYPLAHAVRDFERVRGIRIKHVAPVRIGGYPGRRYGLVLEKTVSLNDVFGVAADLQPGEPDLILLGVRGGTLLIRRGFDEDQERPEIERVVRSFRFPPSSMEAREIPLEPPRRGITEIGSGWARLFAAARDEKACGYQTQPLCERIICERVGHREIRNCTPPSLAFRRSFEHATVMDVEILGDQAGVRFSNGQTIVLVAVEGGAWLIHKLRDANGKFFQS